MILVTRRASATLNNDVPPARDSTLPRSERVSTHVTGDGNIYFNTGAACSIVNNGTFGKSGGTGTSSVTVGVTNAAGGTIKATSGILSFTNGLAQSGNDLRGRH